MYRLLHTEILRQSFISTVPKGFPGIVSCPWLGTTILIMVSFSQLLPAPPQLPSLPTQLHVLFFCLKAKAKTEYTRNKTGQDYKNKNKKIGRKQ